jgi:pimeloyl-ACP methyl ester carboxylesterase
VPLRELDLPSGPLAVREWGEPQGVPFLFWHSVGPGGTGEMFAVAAEPLGRAGFRVVALDAPGFGLSPAREPDAYALDRLGALLWEVADAFGLERAVFAGHSWGGAVAVAAAGQRPDRALGVVLYDSGHVDYADWPGWTGPRPASR